MHGLFFFLYLEVRKVVTKQQKVIVGQNGRRELPLGFSESVLLFSAWIVVWDGGKG